MRVPASAGADKGLRVNMTKVLILTEGDYRAGPYGVDLLPRRGFETTGVTPLSGPVRRKVRDVVEHRSGVRVDVPLRGALLARKVDLVLGLLETVA